MIKFILLLLSFVVFYIYDSGLFRICERKCCRKVNGNCEECKAWSCKRKEILYEEEKNNKE